MFQPHNDVWLRKETRMKTVTFEMRRSKETKGTVVFTAISDAPITTLYVLKGNAFSAGEILSVTLEVAEQGGWQKTEAAR